MNWLRLLAAGYFAVALYGVLRANEAPFIEVLPKAALLVGLIALLVAWESIFPEA